MHEARTPRLQAIPEIQGLADCRPLELVSICAQAQCGWIREGLCTSKADTQAHGSAAYAEEPEVTMLPEDRISRVEEL